MYQITKALANLRKFKKDRVLMSVGEKKIIDETISLLEKADMKLEGQAEYIAVASVGIVKGSCNELWCD